MSQEKDTIRQLIIEKLLAYNTVDFTWYRASKLSQLTDSDLLYELIYNITEDQYQRGWADCYEREQISKKDKE